MWVHVLEIHTKREVGKQRIYQNLEHFDIIHIKDMIHLAAIVRRGRKGAL